MSLSPDDVSAQGDRADEVHPNEIGADRPGYGARYPLTKLGDLVRDHLAIIRHAALHQKTTLDS